LRITINDKTETIDLIEDAGYFTQLAHPDYLERILRAVKKTLELPDPIINFKNFNFHTEQSQDEVKNE